MYRAETVEQRVDGGWWNEDAVVQQLKRPVYTAQTEIIYIIYTSNMHFRNFATLFTMQSTRMQGLLGMKNV